MGESSKPSRAALLAFAFAAAALGQKEITNNTGAPLALQKLTDKSGNTAATLYVMPGETMTLDSHGDPQSGAGYYEYALQGKDYGLSPALSTFPPVKFEGHFDFPLLHVDKVAWDTGGRLTTITGLQPVLGSSPLDGGGGPREIKITSDVNDPKIADGSLYIRLDGRPKEYAVKILFGRIVAIEAIDFTLFGLGLRAWAGGAVAAVLVGLAVWFLSRRKANAPEEDTRIFPRGVPPEA